MPEQSRTAFRRHCPRTEEEWIAGWGLLGYPRKLPLGLFLTVPKKLLPAVVDYELAYDALTEDEKDEGAEAHLGTCPGAFSWEEDRDVSLDIRGDGTCEYSDDFYCEGSSFTLGKGDGWYGFLEYFWVRLVRRPEEWGVLRDPKRNAQQLREWGQVILEAAELVSDPASEDDAVLVRDLRDLVRGACDLLGAVSCLRHPVRTRDPIPCSEEEWFARWRFMGYPQPGLPLHMLLTLPLSAFDSNWPAPVFEWKTLDICVERSREDPDQFSFLCGLPSQHKEVDFSRKVLAQREPGGLLFFTPFVWDWAVVDAWAWCVGTVQEQACFLRDLAVLLRMLGDVSAIDYYVPEPQGGW